MIIKYNNRNIGRIYFHICSHNNKDVFEVDKFIKDVKSSKERGYVGFSTKKNLRNNLEHNETDKIVFRDCIKSDIDKYIGKAFKESYKKAKFGANTHIHIFPTKSKFVKNKMNGVSGFTPYKNIMLLYISAGIKRDEKFYNNLESTIAHEYNHSLWARNFALHKHDTILDSLIMEGLAQIFEKQVTKRRSIMLRGFNQGNIKEYYIKSIKNNLDSRNYKTYQRIFFGDKETKSWLGYAVGYYMVSDYIKKTKTKDWKKLIKTKPEEILKISGWDTLK